MVKASTVELENWEHRVAEAGGSLEFDVDADIHTISGRALAYTAFGYDSFEKGQQIYNLQRQYAKNLFEAFQRPTFWIPGFRYVTIIFKAFPQLHFLHSITWLVRNWYVVVMEFVQMY
jgi:hypothetical protein